MFRRKLEALQYPDRDQFTDTDECQYRCLVVWLEERLIGALTVQQRAPLHCTGADDSDGGAAWPGAFSSYLTRLQCPHSPHSRRQCLDWLLSLAVARMYKSREATQAGADRCRKDAGSAKPLLQLNWADPDCAAAVAQLASRLNVTAHPEPQLTLAAACQLILDCVKRQQSKHAPKAVAEFSLQCLPGATGACGGGGDCDQPWCQDAVRALRLLHARQLCDLQQQVNESLSSLQTLVADPHTDTSIGQIGI